MESLENTDPLPKRLYTVGLTFNLKKGVKTEVEDLEAEFDNMETVTAIKEALEAAGCKVELLEADEGILKKITNTKADIVFNIAEGIYGRGREAQVPALLNFLEIPFTGSDETTLCIALDKALSKRLLSTYKIKTPKYRVVTGVNANACKGLRYPLIVKPNAEGSSKGVSDLAVVDNVEELKNVLKANLVYGCPMLVEEYIAGREFTVGLVGNGSDLKVFPPMEIAYRKKNRSANIYSFNVKKNYKEYIDYYCPAPIEPETEERLKDISRKIFTILECRDFSRIDFRMSPEGEIYFIEINPLPGLAPGYSDFPMIAEFNGIGHAELVRSVLNSALKRYGMAPLTAQALVAAQAPLTAQALVAAQVPVAAQAPLTAQALVAAQVPVIQKEGE
ncbi:MAG: ATP-grasp domain-containing protein [Eubacteriales bacterium]|nr:ATP-grasp domain-containing protein [Eubacteriales bacterium]